MSELLPAAAQSRQIRVFLSSTFRDFMKERDLLVKEVFPELRRKARERGVDVVDVDLRWGITEEESRQGKVIPICLGEIDRCRPYFVGMLGERYGWIPPADQYSPELIERQPWLKEHQGGVSVTELEILHGVLNDPAMAGRAFFYLRDPAWSQKQKQPGYVCENKEEEQKLSGLKQRIRTSNFPVQENLPDPKALADRIGADLWELIEHQYPDLDCADALAREERQHASYRRSRLSVYLGGQTYIKKLERWIDVDQQSILITGESGAGKSALIANWMEAHQRTHPDDHIYCHHLDCSNDASSIRPLLARLIETAKQQLPEVYGYSLDVPQDWWELVAKAAEALQSLGRWAQQNNHRWIWVLDGLDRLDPDDQNALPWLPLTIPEGVVLVISALDCPGREILLEREFKVLTIGPLKAKEQDALIKQYLGRYTKQLIAELRSTILRHPLAGLPLFLRVLLEELRLCGRYETLPEQLAGYLTVETIDDLYERVLERLEEDGNRENVRKVMTALWACRAGLSEEDLLAITNLAPLQWAPIDLALEQAFGLNGNRLVFNHDYLRKAVENRYLPSESERMYAYRNISDAIILSSDINEASSRNLINSLARAGESEKLARILISDPIGEKIITLSRINEILEALSSPNLDQDGKIFNRMLDSIADSASTEIAISEGRLVYWASMGEMALQSGLPHKASIKCFEACHKILKVSSNNIGLQAVILHKKALAYCNIGDYVNAEKSLREFLEIKCTSEEMSKAWIRDEGDSTKGIDRESSLSLLGIILGEQFRFHEAEQVLREVTQKTARELGNYHPIAMSYRNNWLLAVSDLRDSQGSTTDNRTIIDLSVEHRQIYEGRIRALGRDHLHTLVSQNNLAIELFNINRHNEAIELLKDCMHKRVLTLGCNHQHVLDTLSNLATFNEITGHHEDAINLRLDEQRLFEKMMPLPPKHLIQSMCALTCSYLKCDKFDEAKKLADQLKLAINTMSIQDSQMAEIISKWWKKMLFICLENSDNKNINAQKVITDILAVVSKTN